MCGGGGGSPRAPDPMKQAEAEIKQMQERARIDEAARLSAETRAAGVEAKKRGEWDTQVRGARGRAGAEARGEFQRAGLNPADYDSRINAALDNAQGGLTYGKSAPTFATDLGENLLGDIRGERVRGLTGQVNKFAPEGFEETAFGSTADDAILDAILNEQYGGASDAVMRAKARGNLNDTGFDYAMKNLDTQKAAGGSRLQGIGGGVLEGYRGQLGDIAERARTGASSWDFGDTFDPNTYKTQLTTRQGELGKSLGGDIRNAVGGEQFFNIEDLIAKAGVSQGAQNTGIGGAGLLGAIAERKKDEGQNRGLGTQGSF